MLKSPIFHILSFFSSALSGVCAIAIKAVISAKTMLLMISLAFLLFLIDTSFAIAQESTTTSHTNRLSVTNLCEFPVWMATIPNANNGPLELKDF